MSISQSNHFALYIDIQHKITLTAMYPSIHYLHWYPYWGCARYCTAHYGGLASIWSNHELAQMNSACYDVLVNPKAKNQRDHDGNWRGHSCYIGLRRPFKNWDDKRKVKFTKWYPGEPNDWGKKEDCTEAYIWHGGKWNDVNCHSKRSCICQDPRGVVMGPYIGIQAERRYSEASQYCKSVYGTELATIKSDADNKAALDLCKHIAMPHTTPHCWIGLQRPFHEWNDGTNAEEKYDNWYPGEPNNKHEKCTEIYSEHRGLWNDLPCHYRRYFLCNVQTKIQRMDFHDREEMIAKRLGRHKLKWQAYQQAAYRKKVRKAFFEKLKVRQALVRKQAREQQQRMKEYYRQMAFNNMMGKVGQQSNSLSAAGYGAMRGPVPDLMTAFKGDSAFADNFEKRRRMREWIEQNSEGIKREQNMRKSVEKQKMMKKHRSVRDKEALRSTDDNTMFYDETHELDMTEEQLKEVEENVNPSPKRCIFVKDGEDLFELCMNDDLVEISKYVEKRAIFDGVSDEDLIGDDEDLESVELNDGRYSYQTNNTFGDYDMMDFQKFENFRYKQAMIRDMMRENGTVDENGLSVKKVEKVQYLRSNEYIYDHEGHHKKQCFEDNKEVKVCLQFMEDNEEMLLFVDEYTVYVDTTYNYISFNDDEDWNEIQRLTLMDQDKENENIKKCVNFNQRKICVVKKLTKNKYFKKHLKYNEYRVIIIKQMSEENQDDEFAEMIKDRTKFDDSRDNDQYYDY